MKLLTTLFLFVLTGAIFVVGLGVYLGPDGMKNCGEVPANKGDECVKADAIVVVSGGDTKARTAQGIELFKKGWSNYMVLSGAAADKSGPSNAEAMKLQAIDAGVPESLIMLDETSETTKENASNSINIFKDYQIKSVILVTSAYHQRRAGLEFGKRAENTIKIINHPVKEDNQWDGWWWTRPSGWYLAVSELAKIAIFYIGGSR
ncbi:YdcF family protein [Candidatus Saccharibacteria bacterium]|nr:YdcF family protein [Candidatus Saccharibacteria bacterium]